MKNILLIIALAFVFNASAASSILIGEYTLSNEKEGCAASLTITKVDKCFTVESDAIARNLCRVNLGPATKKLKTLKNDREQNQAFETTNVVKLGNVLSEYKTTSIRNKYYQTVTRSFETTTYTATKDTLYISNSRSKMALAPNGSTLRCKYTRVAE